jgi:3-oxoacid CoA-transferase subunit A
MMIVALAREILNSVAQHGHKLILAGAGIGATAAFLAYCQLREQGDDIELVTGNGQLGYTPVPGRSILTNEAGVRSAKMLTDTVTMQGVLVGGAHSRCLSILGAGQIDKFGNINSTRSGKGTFLVGSGGANDAMNAREVFLCVDQSPERFAAKLAHLTACGTAVTTVVSTAGVFRKGRPHEEMYLAACFTGGQSPDLAALVDNVRQQCGWDLKVSSQVAAIPGPTESELRLLRWIVGSSPKE